MTISAPYDTGALQSRGVACKMHETKEEVPPGASGVLPSAAPRQDATGTHRNVAAPAPFSAPLASPFLHLFGGWL